MPPPPVAALVQGQAAKVNYHVPIRPLQQLHHRVVAYPLACGAAGAPPAGRRAGPPLLLLLCHVRGIGLVREVEEGEEEALRGDRVVLLTKQL